MDRPDKIATLSFFVTFAQLTFFLHIRGAGWDGDSIVSATQFVKLFNPNIYGLYDGGTHPKLLSIILFGSIYQIFGNFLVLTYIAIFINSLMVSFVCKWVEETGGSSLIALFGITLNVVWSNIVINCDNPGFSIPFLFMGIYFYAHKRKKVIAALLLLISSLFRPGADFILVALLCIELWQYKKNTENRCIKPMMIMVFITIIAFVNTRYGYIFAYPTEEIFKFVCNGDFDPLIVYKGSFYNTMKLYSESVVTQTIQPVTALFTLLALLGGGQRVIQNDNSIKYVLLSPLSSLILPIGAFTWGTPGGIIHVKHMEFTLLMPILASYSFCTVYWNYFVESRKFYQYFITLIISVILLIVIWKSAVNLQGEWEVNPNGTGKLAAYFTDIPEIKSVINRNLLTPKSFTALISERDVWFFVLNNGFRSKRIQFIEDLDDEALMGGVFDVVMIPVESFGRIHKAYFKYTNFDISSRILLLNTNSLKSHIRLQQ